jgi:peroxiredoxin
MKKMMRTIVAAAALLFALVPTLSAQQAAPEGLSEAQQMLYNAGFGVPKKEIDAPDFTLKNLAGQEVSLRDYRGQVVLINLWASWCPPCRSEMPSMQALYDRFDRDDFTILAVAAPNPPRETRAKIEEFINDGGFTFPILLDTSHSVYSTYGSGSVPTSWIVGPEGKLVARLVGARDWNEDSIVKALERLFS